MKRKNLTNYDDFKLIKLFGNRGIYQSILFNGLMVKSTP